MQYFEVILPLALPKNLIYAVQHSDKKYKPGMRVVAALGKNSRLYTGILNKEVKPPKDNIHLKSITEIVDQKPIVTTWQLQLWEWMADYYMCTLGEIMIAALPSGLKLTSELKIFRTVTDAGKHHLSAKENLILSALDGAEYLTFKDIESILGIKSYQKYLKQLQEKGLIALESILKSSFRPKTADYITLSKQLEKNESGLQNALDTLVNAPRQLELMMQFLHLNRFTEDATQPVAKNLLLKGKITRSTLNSLIKKGILNIETKEIGRYQTDNSEAKPKAVKFSAEQQWALKQIEKEWQQKNVTLLHGVTSSGKTQIYIELIKKTLDQGKQVLYLVPEIALTTQLLERLEYFFGSHMAAYHSRLSESEKTEIWQGMLTFNYKENSRFQIILGARSAVFLPYKKLGLIIVDEEHDQSYRQQNPAPRYQGKNVAVYLANLHGATVLLGSATPSVTSMHASRSGKYGYAELKERYGGVKKPEIKMIDMRTKQHLLPGSHYISKPLLKVIEMCLAERKQVILFQNRRGFSSTIQCSTCGWVPECMHCDISLTYHKSINQMRCHYCGYHFIFPDACEKCLSNDIKLRGIGTERIQEELKQHLPNAKTARLDLDSTRRKYAYQDILQQFSDGLIDVLIGTQMVAKGLDFSRVALVGIINADTLLYYPQYSNDEAAFQLLTQVSGRAGRRKEQGLVLVQTYNPQHNILNWVRKQMYKAMFDAEIEQRQSFSYPPFSRLLQISCRHKDYKVVKQSAITLAKILKEQLGGWVLGPEMPAVNRVRNKFIFNILIKVPIKKSSAKTKQLVAKTIKQLQTNADFRKTQLLLETDF